MFTGFGEIHEIDRIKISINFFLCIFIFTEKLLVLLPVVVGVFVDYGNHNFIITLLDNLI